MDRKSGILLHPTSLPSTQGIGDLGPDCIAFLDYLKDCGCGIWQILPLGPTGYGDSPYQAFSAFAGNPLLIHTGELVEWGLLEKKENPSPTWARRGPVQYGRVIELKERLLRLAFERFCQQKDSELWEEFSGFFTMEGWWLHDYALFMSIKQDQQQRPWWEWPEQLRKRRPEAMQEINEGHQPEILYHKFCQWLFRRQWLAVRAAAEERDIRIVGDLPIFVSWDSADVWAWPHYFRLKEDGQLAVKTGVPPDYFSPTGQLWGNPHYDWNVMQQDGFWWWRSRVHALQQLVHTIRIDHFRGFEAAWEVPGDAETAENGQWVKAPGEALFRVLHNALPGLDLVAEDLGVITPEVTALKERFGYPGLKIFQFSALEGNESFLPHNYEKDCVAYTGSHDNDTLEGFLDEAPAEAAAALEEWLGVQRREEILPASLRALWASTANWVVIPMQDLLGLGGEARMNVPGTTQGNWRWRMNRRYRNKKQEEQLRAWNRIYERS